MLESAHSVDEALPRAPLQTLLSVGTLTSFGWLLLQNKIHPVLVYLLQVYLTF